MMIKRLFGMAACLLLAACIAQEGSSQELAVSQVIFTSPEGKTAHIQVEIAQDEKSRNKGLMFRENLDFGKGMAFMWEEPGIYKMWMKNTYIPLDIIFIHDKHIVGMVQGAKPHDLTPVGPDVKSNWAIEVPAGYIEKVGLTPSWTVSLQNEQLSKRPN